jgi:uncharacterized protein (DUF1330 family)
MRKGSKMTIEQRKKLSNAHIGQTAWNKGLKGYYKHSPETIKKMSIGIRKNLPKTAYRKGNISWSKLHPESMPKGENNSCWKGGKIIYNGYYYIYLPNHHSQKLSNYVAEHRVIMEKYLGRNLKSEEKVHHIDGNKLNNCIKNLKLFSNESKHQKFHNSIKLFYINQHGKTPNPNCIKSKSKKR